MKKRIVLASASPRRKELLEQIGLRFEVDPSNHDEQVDKQFTPHELAMALSQEKARAVAARHPNAIIIAADTFIVLGDQIMGKAHSDDEALDMLTSLNGRRHSVITGFTVFDTDTNQTATQAAETTVEMRQLSPDEIEAYVHSGEPIGKAGAYAIQGLGAVLIDRIEGDFSNVVGLPLSALATVLKDFGIRLP